MHMGPGKPWYGVPRDVVVAFENAARVHRNGGETISIGKLRIVQLPKVQAADEKYMKLKSVPYLSNRTTEVEKQALSDDVKMSDVDSASAEAVPKEKTEAMETPFRKGITITSKEIEVLTELLMKELLKLDGIEAEGEAKAQRRTEEAEVEESKKVAGMKVEVTMSQIEAVGASQEKALKQSEA
ncbi:BAG family molecular chaperone regulator 4 [Tanacetum coccineum]